LADCKIQCCLYGIRIVYDAPFCDSSDRYFFEDSVASGYAVQALWIFALGYIPWGIGIAIIQSFNGAGDTMIPTWINVFCFWLVQVPLAYSLAMVLEFWPVGVFWAVFVSDVLTGIVGYSLFRRGKWKLREL
jgi:Na+-driven multidrug efflux pump